MNVVKIIYINKECEMLCWYFFFFFDIYQFVFLETDINVNYIICFDITSLLCKNGT